jgi:hypothetical protein
MHPIAWVLIVGLLITAMFSMYNPNYNANTKMMIGGGCLTGMVAIAAIFILFIDTEIATCPSEEVSTIQTTNSSTDYTIEELGLVLFFKPTCGYCVKFKAMLDAGNYTQFFQLVNIDDNPGVLSNLPGNPNGVPVVYSTVTQKTCVGYRPTIEAVLAELL